jgi:DNA-binding MarR family transcriptional regulator/N-acetylglutamate synthase-like GNAT family acetyltransferase
MAIASQARVDAVRRFNRFYTRRIGVLRPALYASRYSLAEVRVLYELAHTERPVTASALAASLELDPGYLSRILRIFAARGYTRRTRSVQDGRERPLTMTDAGRKAFAPLDRASAVEVAALLAPLSDEVQSRVTVAMRAIEDALSERAQPAPVVLREHRPGDIGWVIARHGALYAQEYGWDMTFEALVAEIAAKFVREFDPRSERCWIAERDGVNVGCVFVVRRSAKVAQLRLLLVEPTARGLGVGRRLVAECLAFARAAGYRRMMLWTNGGLDAARHLYDEAGFQLSKEERHRSFGKDLVGQTFELDL